MTPKTHARQDLVEERIAELTVQIPEKIKRLIEKMPKGTGECIRETMMNAAVYFNEFHARWHDATFLVESTQAKKKHKKEDAKKVHEENERWGEEAEKAMKAAFPKMGKTIEAAEAIEQAIKQENADKEAAKKANEKTAGMAADIE